jgi:hypothetical protein
MAKLNSYATIGVWPTVLKSPKYEFLNPPSLLLSSELMWNFKFLRRSHSTLCTLIPNYWIKGLRWNLANDLGLCPTIRIGVFFFLTRDAYLCPCCASPQSVLATLVIAPVASDCHEAFPFPNPEFLVSSCWFRFEHSCQNMSNRSRHSGSAQRGLHHSRQTYHLLCR